MVDLTAGLDLFGSHIGGGTQSRASGREREMARAFTEQLRDAEVGDPHPATGIDENVLRLDVPMQHAVVVRELKGSAEIGNQGERLLRREKNAPLASLGAG